MKAFVYFKRDNKRFIVIEDVQSVNVKEENGEEYIYIERYYGSPAVFATRIYKTTIFQN